MGQPGSHNTESNDQEPERFQPSKPETITRDGWELHWNTLEQDCATMPELVCSLIIDDEHTLRFNRYSREYDPQVPVDQRSVSSILRLYCPEGRNKGTHFAYEELPFEYPASLTPEQEKEMVERVLIGLANLMGFFPWLRTPRDLFTVLDELGHIYFDEDGKYLDDWKSRPSRWNPIQPPGHFGQ